MGLCPDNEYPKLIIWMYFVPGLLYKVILRGSIKDAGGSCLGTIDIVVLIIVIYALTNINLFLLLRGFNCHEEGKGGDYIDREMFFGHVFFPYFGTVLNNLIFYLNLICI